MRVAASPPFALFHLQIFGRLLAPVRHDFVVDFLPLVESAQSRPLHCRNVNEHVFSAATGWLNEAIALGRIEPLHSSTSHVASPACPKRRELYSCAAPANKGLKQHPCRPKRRGVPHRNECSSDC